LREKKVGTVNVHEIRWKSDEVKIVGASVRNSRGKRTVCPKSRKEAEVLKDSEDTDSGGAGVTISGGEGKGEYR